MQKRSLPIGTQTFESLRQNDCLYVDKTQYLHSLITTGRVYFLSRPRRFGKSLTVTTLESIFNGKKELFDGLFISSTDYDWKRYPVVRIDMSSLVLKTPEFFETELRRTLTETAQSYGVCLLQNDSKIMFSQLIQTLASQSHTGKVVVLIDEYDKPIIEHITDIPIATQMRDILKSFYGILKPMDAFLKFVFITGVSKFSRTSIFSDLNHLSDLTLHPKYASLCGYTQSELEANFEDYILETMATTALSRGALLDKIKFWYNGYRFSRSEDKVYNPFSTLIFFDRQEFAPHWFETGSPTFLMKLIEAQDFDIESAEAYEADETFMSDYHLESLRIVPLLFQTGYLTIGGYYDGLYTLNYPNHEVKSAFLKVVLESRARTPGLGASTLHKLVTAIEAQNITVFFDHMKTLFAQIPYDIHIKQERYYQSLFYLIFALIGCKITAEVRTNKGRIDAVVETKTDVYIFEFKLEFEKTSPEQMEEIAQLALRQIDTHGYVEKYADRQKLVHKIGVAFDGKARNVGTVILG